MLYQFEMKSSARGDRSNEKEIYQKSLPNASYNAHSFIRLDNCIAQYKLNQRFSFSFKNIKIDFEPSTSIGNKRFLSEKYLT